MYKAITVQGACYVTCCNGEGAYTEGALSDQQDGWFAFSVLHVG